MLLLSLLASKTLRHIKKTPALPASTAASVAESNANKLSSKGVLLLSPLLPPFVIPKRRGRPLGSKNKFKSPGAARSSP